MYVVFLKNTYVENKIMVYFVKTKIIKKIDFL